MPIDADVDASEAFGAQQGIDYFNYNTSLKSKRNIGVVFVVPIQGINKKEGMLSLLIDKTSYHKTRVKILK